MSLFPTSICNMNYNLSQWPITHNSYLTNVIDLTQSCINWYLLPLSHFSNSFCETVWKRLNSESSEERQPKAYSIMICIHILKRLNKHNKKSKWKTFANRPCPRENFTNMFCIADSINGTIKITARIRPKS